MSQHLGDPFEVRGFRLFDIETKTVILQGSGESIAKVLNVRSTTIHKAAVNKSRVTSKRDGKQYAVRFASTKTA